ncbi:MAG: hypothetical protein Q9184_003650 [Pyrenodesmia sp. 2 TL-2023]
MAPLREVKIGAARVLPSGDWRFSATMPKWTELLRIHRGEWVSPKASIATPTFGVVVDGIKVDTVCLDDQQATIQEFQRQNIGVLTAERKIERVHWLSKPRRNHCSLVFESTEVEASNFVVGCRELFWSNQVRRVRRFVPGCSINQCFNCHRTPLVVAFVRIRAMLLLLAPVSNKGGKAKRALCGLAHPAWSPDCKVRKEQKSKTKAKVDAAPMFWAEPPESADISPSPSLTDSGPFTFRVAKIAGAKRPLEVSSNTKSNASARTPKKLAPKATAAIKTPREKEAEKEKEGAEMVEEDSVLELSKSTGSSDNPFKITTRRRANTAASIVIHEDDE